jgi:hypothetical protein
MKSKQLFHEDGKPSGVWYCGECGRIHRNAGFAASCCDWRCSKCGQPAPKGWTICDPCRAKQDDAKERAQFDAAEKVTEWDGWVFCDGMDYNNGFFEGIAEFLDFCEDESEPGVGHNLPEYVWTCKANHFVKVDCGDITERMADSAYEDWDPDDLNGIPELTSALAAFVAANKDVVSYAPDYTKAVLLAAATKA